MASCELESTSELTGSPSLHGPQRAAVLHSLACNKGLSISAVLSLHSQVLNLYSFYLTCRQISNISICAKTPRRLTLTHLQYTCAHLTHAHISCHKHSTTHAVHLHSITHAAHLHSVTHSAHLHSITHAAHLHSITHAAHLHSITHAAHLHSITHAAHLHSITHAAHLHCSFIKAQDSSLLCTVLSKAAILCSCAREGGSRKGNSHNMKLLTDQLRTYIPTYIHPSGKTWQ